MQILQYEIGEKKALLRCYIQEASAAIDRSAARPAVLILPGGGYEFVSDAERECVALAYSAKGFQAFTLQYSVKENGVFPAPQREAFAALAFLRQNAEKLLIDPAAVAVAGFSAGGHLAASTGVFWKDSAINAQYAPELCRPDAMVLIYPCIMADEYAYPGIREVHGKGTLFPERLSMERYVDRDTPPTFLCHTAADTCVPSLNSLFFAEALARAGVAYELHVYKDGPHGMSLATKAVSSPYLKTFDEGVQRAVRAACARFSDWFEKSVEFLRLVFQI